MASFVIEHFIEEANQAKSTEDVSALFAKALKSFGYDRFCYSLITDHPSVGLRAGHGIAENYPDDWMAHYRANKYEKIDPVPRRGLMISKPFTWDWLENTRELKTEEKQVMNEAREARLFDGVAIPFIGHNGEVAGIGLASSVGKIKPDINLVSRLRMLASQFHAVFIELERKDSETESDAVVHLTSREQEILLWAAEGKSDSIIAEIIGISHATVRFHMNNIFKKLNANERTLATVKAIRHGLILPSYVG